MFKLSHLFHSSRNQLLQKRLLGEDVKDWFLFTSRACMCTATQTFAANGRLSDRVFAGYTIYKGKACLSAEPALPTFSKLNSGALKIDRRGAMMLTFCPAIGEHKYDHEKRQIFALSATEVGSFISLGPNDSCEFFHDPSMKTSNAGQVRKNLSVKAVADGSGYFISLNVVNNLLKTNDRFTVHVTTAEFTVMRTAFSFSLPHILGWAHSINQLPKNFEENPSKVLPQQMDSEWDR